jgi:hypothetical protein
MVGHPHTARVVQRQRVTHHITTNTLNAIYRQEGPRTPRIKRRMKVTAGTCRFLAQCRSRWHIKDMVRGNVRGADV